MTNQERHFTTLFRQRDPSRPILQCFRDAKRHVQFRARLEADAKAFKKRSAAAKKAWKKRNAA